MLGWPDNSRMSQSLTTEHADEFWRAFRAHEQRLAALPAAEFVAVLGQMLAPFAPTLSIELDNQPADHAPDKRALRVTAHGNSARFPDVLLLVAQANGLHLHSVQAFRSRVPNPRFALQKDGFRLSTREVLVCHHDSEGLAGLEIALPPLPEAQQRLAQRMVHEMLAHVLGEWDLAIRTGPVAFVDGLLRHRLPCPLSEYAPGFDAFLAGGLGYSDKFPIEDDGPWRMLPLRDAQDRPQLLVVINTGAQAVAMRPDLCHAVWLTLPVWDEASLRVAHEAQHGVAMRLQRERAGVMVMAKVEAGNRRAALYHVCDPREVARAMQAQGVGAQARVDVRWDPRWQHYRHAVRLPAAMLTKDSLFQSLSLL